MFEARQDLLKVSVDVKQQFVDKRRWISVVGHTWTLFKPPQVNSFSWRNNPCRGVTLNLISRLGRTSEEPDISDNHRHLGYPGPCSGSDKVTSSQMQNLPLATLKRSANQQHFSSNVDAARSPLECNPRRSASSLNVGCSPRSKISRYTSAESR